MKLTSLQEKIDSLINQLGDKSSIVIKKFYIGEDDSIKAAIVYVNQLVDKNIIDRDVLTPLMLHTNKKFILNEEITQYLCEKYIPMSNAVVERDINICSKAVRLGKTVVFIEGVESFIIIAAEGGPSRSISEPPNETSMRGAREGFIESLEANIGILRKKINDKNLAIDLLRVGKGSETNLALAYIDDVVDRKLLEEIKKRVNSINMGTVIDGGQLEQLLEDSPYSPFPQIYGTERPDVVVGNILEGRVALILNGTPNVLIAPAIFVQFFQGVEDYNERTIVASFSRVLRVLAFVLIITISPTYLTLISYNVELIPLKFITPIVQSREGIALTPILEILSMEIVVEFLREGGLRLPPKIASTLSIVGGIIIGNTAVQSKVVSPTTLLIVGISVVATFLIPNYEMSLAVRFLRFPMLLLANAMGFLGIAAGWFLILLHLCSLKSFGVQYFSITSSDIKDIFIRAPIWMFNKRPEAIPNSKPQRLNQRPKRFRGEKDGER